MNGEPIRILLVEDDTGDARLLREMLVDAGMMPSELVWSKRLEEALQCLSAEPFDVILLDLSLPDSQGLDTFTRVHAHSSDVAIVVLTGLDDEAVAISAMGGGAQDYLVKGYVDGQLLMRAIRYAIERQRLAGALEQSRQEQLKLKDQFLSHVSHELRSPLTAIHGFVTILLDGLGGDLTPKQREFLDITLRNANQLKTMIGDLLDATRAQASKLVIEPQCLSFLDVVPEIVQTLALSADAKHIAISAEMCSFLPPVCADPQRVRQILSNLVENAIKFTPEHGEIHIQASVYEADPAFLCVAVRDTGCGISPEASGMIFERLYQEANVNETSRKGLGLGLYICRELVTAHGGRIWVESRLGQGSTFFFTLPVFPLAGLLAPLSSTNTRRSDALVLIAVEVFFRRRPASISTQHTFLRQAWQALQRCILQDRDVLLPRMAHLGASESFFIVACTDRCGAEAIVGRIREQQEFSHGCEADGIDVRISTTPVETPAERREPEEPRLNDIVARIEGLVQTAMSQRKTSNAEAKNFDCRG
jgi:sigma-B regulation protein RsbU (phosphoserine phosphatase)